MPADRDRRIKYGQNFLHDPRLVQRLVGQSSIEPGDVVVEIGPGRGILTDVLAQRAGHVIAIERDARMVAVLRHRYRLQPNVTVFAADVREFPMPSTAYKVFANLPFRVTADVVAKLTSGTSPPTDSYLLVQHEAALRFLGEPQTTLVSIRLCPWFAGEIVHTFRRSDFRPAPGVDSVLLRLTTRATALIDPGARSRYDDMVVALFTAWAPTVHDALVTQLGAMAVGSLPMGLQGDLRVRPSACPMDVWLALFDALRKIDGGRVFKTFDGAADRLERQQSTLQKDHRSRTARR